MSIIVFIDSYQNKVKKSAYEVISYARAMSKESAKKLKVVVLNVDQVDELMQYVGDNTEIIKIKSPDLKTFSAKNYAEAILSVADDNDHTFILSHSNMGSTIAAFISVSAKASLITNVLGKPQKVSPFTVKRKSFSGKGIMTVSTEAEKMVVTLMPHSSEVVEAAGKAPVKEVSFDGSKNSLNVNSVVEPSGKINLKEADVVVSAGRGLKGPENWKMVEELADLMGAATACSKPVSDSGWRPHSEHVGQTGIAIAPDLYIAIGISGAIQHLAGVNASKKIVVINNDPEAPFFKAADYGVCADAFDVVPRLIDKIKAMKN